MTHSTYGRHIALDVWGVDSALLNNVVLLKEILVDAAYKCGATVLSVDYKTFVPSGCTILVLLSESHLSIHTYPDKTFAAIDCYVCGERVDPKIAMQYIIENLKPNEVFTKMLIRGTKEIEVLG